MRASTVILFAVVVAVTFHFIIATNVATVSNIKNKVDSKTGEIVDIHDGTTIRINGTFFWYGAGYGPCSEMTTGCASIDVGSCGFNLNHTINMATSPDLEHWTFRGAVLTAENRPEGILFSPWVAQSHSTGQYVMWVNILPVVDGRGDFGGSRYTVATSVSPFGPFVTVVANVTGLQYNRLPDAASIFVDDDGKGYIAFTHEDSHINHVQQLTPDLLSALPAISDQVGPTNQEGTIMFKRNNTYYVAFGDCCCFCADGGDVKLYKSNSPLGPYTFVTQVVTAADWRGQTGSIWNTGVDWVLFGDRWQSAPDRIKAHDLQYMAPLNFRDDGSVDKLSWQDVVTIRY